ncbi:hypothetical protein DBR32_15520 [Taibaiella sp. KBW10]|uniref:hypothetical protein n=1 Tax=Taibaiella sp. KBW10 TaxID=2153357 RepID=UPI000FA6ED5D|nr:hypothetical protein [Taibaiella sp. KBW10]RQO29666.1 hypothetical protein DBR32_15520 [Taibaiella sp. KBW10]
MEHYFDQEIRIKKENKAPIEAQNHYDIVRRLKNLWLYFESTVLKHDQTGKSYNKQLSLYVAGIPEGAIEINTIYDYLRIQLIPRRHNTILFERLAFERTTRNVISRALSSSVSTQKEKIKIIILIAKQINQVLIQDPLNPNIVNEYHEVFSFINQFLAKLLSDF